MIAIVAPPRKARANVKKATATKPRTTAAAATIATPIAVPVQASASDSESMVSVEDDEDAWIPQFINEEWDTKILPSLYHLLFVSHSPFTDFSKASGEKSVASVQHVLDAVYPLNTYVVESDDPVFKKV
jgi:hypothetical protein